MPTNPQLLAIAAASAAISLAALIVAIVALWRTHFSTQRPTVAVGLIRHRIYPIRNEKQRWFLTSFNLPLTIANSGAQALLIDDIRLSLHYPDVPIPKNHETVPVVWDMDPDSAKDINKDRFTWLKELKHTDWMPVVVLPKATVLKHLIFEKRWDEPVIQRRIFVGLHLHSSASKEWERVATWEIRLDNETWSELANVGTSMGYHPEGSVSAVRSQIPDDLHKYTGSKDPIPEQGFGAHASFLDYPKK